MASESLAFRAICAVVNTAARGANAVLQVMYPPDIAHIWDDPQTSTPAAPDPVDAVDSPPGVDTATPPAASSEGAPLTWRGWALPAVLDVLASHPAYDYAGQIECPCEYPHPLFADWSEWHEHVGEQIVDRIACDPTRAALALTSLQTQ